MSSGTTGDIPLFPVCMQSTPRREFFSFTCRDFTEARVSMGLNPEFSASASGTASNASAKARMAYCSIPGLYVHSSARAIDSNQSESASYLYSSIFYSERAGNFSSTSAIHNPVVPNQIADDAKCIME